MRDYGTATWEGGDDPACEHKVRLNVSPSPMNVNPRSGSHQNEGFKGSCPRCGARRVDRQLGLEQSPEAYVARMVAVFREVKRILRDDGVCFCNLGDSYSSGGRATQCQPSLGHDRIGVAVRPPVCSDIGPKNLVGIPWRVAFALQADGWWLRSDCIEQVELYCPCGCGHVMEERIWRYSQDRDIIWSKPNPMPESVTDRPTKSHEYIFLLTKNERYFWDAEGVREPHAEPWRGNGDPSKYGGSSDYRRGGKGVRTGTMNAMDQNGSERVYNPAGRNIRSVWTITPRPFAGAHFATFPAELVERCIRAGTSERGACPACGKCWERVTERIVAGRPDSLCPKSTGYAGRGSESSGLHEPGWRLKRMAGSVDMGFRQACTCPPAAPVPCVVADPFGGAGTVPLVATNLGRVGIAIELSADYCRMARRRIERPHARPERAAKVEHHPLFPERNP